MAQQQIKGRGRRGRPWTSSKGNFAATLVLFPREGLNKIALRSYVTALAVYEALAMVTTARPTALALKWPNDVLLNGGKVSGILLETIVLQGGGMGLAIGVGVNLAKVPERIRLEARAALPVSVLGETGVEVEPANLLEALAAAYARFEMQFVSYGFAPIRQAWLARAAHLGETITARAGGREITGRFDTIDETGQLVLYNAKGRQVVVAADVFF